MSQVDQPSEGFVFRYDRTRRESQALATTDRGLLGVTVLERGARSQRESWSDVDVVAFVKAGEANVLDMNDEVVAVLKEADVVTIPADTAFSFESTGDDDLELCEFYAARVPLTTDFQPFS